MLQHQVALYRPLSLFQSLFFLCLIAKVKCNPLFVPLPLSLPPPPLRAYMLLLIRFVPAAAAILLFLRICRHTIYPYPITHMPQMSVHQCRVCVWVCAQMGYMHALQHTQCMLHSLLSFSLSLTPHSLLTLYPSLSLPPNTCASCQRVV